MVDGDGKSIELARDDEVLGDGKVCSNSMD